MLNDTSNLTTTTCTVTCTQGVTGVGPSCHCGPPTYGYQVLGSLDPKECSGGDDKCPKYISTEGSDATTIGNHSYLCEASDTDNNPELVFNQPGFYEKQSIRPRTGFGFSTPKPITVGCCTGFSGIKSGPALLKRRSTFITELLAVCSNEKEAADKEACKNACAMTAGIAYQESGYHKKAKSWDWDPYGNNGCSGGTVSAGAAGIFQFDFRGVGTKTPDGKLIVDSSEQMLVVGDLTNKGDGRWTSFSDWASCSTDINVNGSGVTPDMVVEIEAARTACGNTFTDVGKYIASYNCKLTQSQVGDGVARVGAAVGLTVGTALGAVESKI